MAINRILFPDNLSTQADFSKHEELIETGYFDAVTSPLQFVGGVIPQGMVFNIGGVIYRADSDTSITGTASDYVRIVPDGATATANYESTLTGVAWAKQYNGYYDSSTPAALYLFDEGKALKDSPAITALLTRYVTRTESGDTYIGRDLDVKRNAKFGPNTSGRDLYVGGQSQSGLATSEATIGVTSGNLHIDSESSSGLYLQHYAETNTFLNVNGGNVGIGKTPTTKLDVDGNINTGQGATQVHLMNQNVRTTDAVTFSTVNARGYDTFGGFYTGSARDETSLPIGSIIVVRDADNLTYDRNAVINDIRLDDQLNDMYVRGGNGALLAGVWRSRGRSQGSSTINYFVAQRVS